MTLVMEPVSSNGSGNSGRWLRFVNPADNRLAWLNAESRWPEPLIRTQCTHQGCVIDLFA